MERPHAPIDDVMMPFDALNGPAFGNDRVLLHRSSPIGFARTPPTHNEYAWAAFARSGSVGLTVSEIALHGVVPFPDYIRDNFLLVTSANVAGALRGIMASDLEDWPPSGPASWRRYR